MRDLSFIGLFVALIAVMAQLSVPLGEVPMTLQTFAIPLAGIVLGPRKGTLSVVLYLLLGALGLPVFAGFTGGFGKFVSATGGFLLTFPFMAWFAGWGADLTRKSGTKIWLWLGLLVGALVNYAGGTVVFSLISGATVAAALAVTVVPFIPGAVIKVIAAALLGEKLRSLVSDLGSPYPQR